MADWKTAPLHAWEMVRQVVEPFVPGAIGAAVGQFWEPGLSLKQRLIQWSAGLSFAVFIVPAMGHLFGWGDPIVDAVGFVVGTLAFKAVPALRDAFIDGGSDALRNLPDYLPWRRRDQSGDGE